MLARSEYRGQRRHGQTGRRETGVCWVTEAKQCKSFEKQMAFKTCKRGPFPHFTWEDTETLGSQRHIAKPDSNPVGSDVRTPTRGLGQEGGHQMLPLSFPKPRTTGPSSLASSDFSYRIVTPTTTHSQSGPSLRRPLWEHQPQPAPREPSTKGGRWHWGEVTKTPSHGSPTPHGCH